MPTPLIVDAHQDLAWNMLALGRDYTRPVAETRRLESEAESPALTRQGHTMLGSREYRQGRVALVFGTLFVTPAAQRKEWETLFYSDFNEAHRLYRQQVEAYHELVDRHPADFRLVVDRPALEAHLALWAGEDPASLPVGLVPLMEGAEGVRSPTELDLWWQLGVRIIGLAWAGTRFCGGTRQPGPLTGEGREMLRAMAAFPFTLDISHMDELAARQALDLYAGPVIASHANAASLIPAYTSNRHLSDDLIRLLVQRGGIIGLVPSCRFLDNTWQRGDRRSAVPLERVAAQVDHVCQLAGSSQHVGLGTDLDGGFGVQDFPEELDTVADLVKLAPLLVSKGYNDEAVSSVFGGNWIRHLRAHLPA